VGEWLRLHELLIYFVPFVFFVDQSPFLG